MYIHALSSCFCLFFRFVLPGGVRLSARKPLPPSMVLASLGYAGSLRPPQHQSALQSISVGSTQGDHEFSWVVRLRNKFVSTLSLSPLLKSHYSSGKSKARKYLSLLLSVAEMHGLYVEKHESNSETPLSSFHTMQKF